MNNELKLIEVFNFNDDGTGPCFAFVGSNGIHVINKTNFPTEEEALNVIQVSNPVYFRQFVKNGKIKYESC